VFLRGSLPLCALCVALFSAISASSAAPPSGASARRVLADLLKIPVRPPDVSVETTNRRVEDGLVVEDIRWSSLDGQQVTAFLIRPDTAAKLPAVICLHGTGGSRESETTREFGPGDWTRPGDKQPHKRMLGWARELARRGYVTLSITQRGLDRRAPPDTNDQAKDLLVRGRTLMGAIVHEIRQGVTYLERRTDVDPRAIGVAGMSFGGITSFYTWAVDPRIAAMASICGGVGSIDVLLNKGRPSYHGFYWWIPGMLQQGDQAAFAAAQAPRRLMLWAPTNDIGMPKDGVDRFAAEVRPAYARRGADKNLVVHQPPGEHEFTHEAFEALVAFFNASLRQ